MERNKLETVISKSSNNKFLNALMDMYVFNEKRELAYLENINMIDRLSDKKKKLVIARLNYIKAKSTPLPLISVLISTLFTLLNLFLITYFIENGYSIPFLDIYLPKLDNKILVYSNVAVVLLLSYVYKNEQGKISKTTYLLEIFK